MKETVTLFGLDIDVEVDTDKTFTFDEYEKAYVTDDNRLIAYDNGVNEWVQLSGDAETTLRNEQ